MEYTPSDGICAVGDFRTAGTVTSTSMTSRQIQCGLKGHWWSVGVTVRPSGAAHLRPRKSSQEFKKPIGRQAAALRRYDEFGSASPVGESSAGA
jgi:hypothetical protein